VVLHIDLGWLASVLLLAARIAGAVALIPVFGPAELPRGVGIVLVLTLAAALICGLDGSSAAAAAASLASTGALVAAMLAEAMTGAAFAFGLIAANAATQLAGRALDTQMGIGAAGVFNPTLRSVSPLMGTLLGMVGVMIFLSLDGHHVLVRALALFTQSVPPGTLFDADHFPWEALIAQSAVMFTFGLTLAAPVMFSLLLADMVIGLSSRSVPQLNAFVIGFAIKILLGFLGLAAALKMGGSVFERLYMTTFRYWEQLAPAAR
jgi:flagellar biosynthesis protein FliR